MTSPIGDVVVCDASPLIILARVDQLSLLSRLFRDVFVPPAVWSEATCDPKAAGAATILASSWIKVRAPRVVPPSTLGLGEREAMGLAAELHAVLVVDDGGARAAALAMGIKITGMLGVLRRAKRERMIAEVRPVIERMRENGLRVADELVAAILADAG